LGILSLCSTLGIPAPLASDEEGYYSDVSSERAICWWAGYFAQHDEPRLLYHSFLVYRRATHKAGCGRSAEYTRQPPIPFFP